MDVLKSFAAKLEKFVEPLREWIFKHYNNPLLWVTLFVGGLIIFRIAYEALNKDN